jgi:hypothetical protein
MAYHKSTLPGYKPTSNKGKLLPKTLKAFELVDRGEDPKTALQLVNMKENIKPESVNKFKAKYKKYSLTHPKMVKAAKSQIERILSGEAREIQQQKVNKDGQVVSYTEAFYPSDTNIISAVSMVYDRYEPVVQQTVNLNIDIDPVNLDQYRNKIATSEVIDVVT